MNDTSKEIIELFESLGFTSEQQIDTELVGENIQQIINKNFQSKPYTRPPHIDIERDHPGYDGSQNFIDHEYDDGDCIEDVYDDGGLIESFVEPIDIPEIVEEVPIPTISQSYRSAIEFLPNASYAFTDGSVRYRDEQEWLKNSKKDLLSEMGTSNGNMTVKQEQAWLATQEEFPFTKNL